METDNLLSDSPEALVGESSSGSSVAKLENADYESTDLEIVEDTEVPTEAKGTSYLVPEPDVCWPSTSDHEAEVAEVSIAAPGEGVLTVVMGRQQVLMAKPKVLVFGMDFLEPNALTEGELAKIWAEYHIPDSVVMWTHMPLESLSNSNGEAVFFTDVFKHELRLPLRHSVQKICDEGEERKPREVGAVELLAGRSAMALYGLCTELVKNLVSASGTGIRSIGISIQVSLKRLTASKRDVEAIERVRGKLAEDDGYFETLLGFGNLFKVGLITEAEIGETEGSANPDLLIELCLGEGQRQEMITWLSFGEGTNNRREVDGLPTAGFFPLSRFGMTAPVEVAWFSPDRPTVGPNVIAGHKAASECCRV
ncbi:hypothetical protein L3X38_029562 [Prunus dulcis]|uniref:Uncharacterized protein n=1 Tax=Prunus dulcis TaxID=3755 RepID=A0AAD4VRW1_PRUDU|nr:hypothetical protein L3X38_029562 [Prunus dulcis]